MSIIAHAKGATHRQRLRTSRSTETQDIPLCAHMNLTPAATGGVESMDMPLVETLEERVWPEDEPTDTAAINFYDSSAKPAAGFLQQQEKARCLYHCYFRTRRYDAMTMCHHILQ